MILAESLGPDHKGTMNAGLEDLGLILPHGGAQRLFEQLSKQCNQKGEDLRQRW